jgi:hypothetical protein
MMPPLFILSVASIMDSIPNARTIQNSSKRKRHQMGQYNQASISQILSRLRVCYRISHLTLPRRLSTFKHGRDKKKYTI